MTTQMDTPYAVGAYRSNSHEPLPPPKWPEDSNRSGAFDTHLAFGNYANLEPAMEVTTQVQGEEQTIYQRQQEQGKREEVYCDARRWCFQNSSKIPHLLFVLKIVCISFIWVPWTVWIFGSIKPELGHGAPESGVALLIALLAVALMLTSLTLYMTGKKIVHYLQVSGFIASATIVLWLKGSLLGNSSMQTALWAGAFLYFIATIGSDALLWLHSKISTYDGSEFNRIDGMLRFKRRFRRQFVAPFEEFDPVLQLLPSGYGSHDYALWLHHRYTDNKICLATKVHSLGLDQANALAFWDCLQRYMDVTQPLPDLPVLEQSRHLDPVTSAYDGKTGRNPRRWRDQSEKGWLATGFKQLTQQLQQYPWQKQPCIIKARIDPSLSIETYYRAQEAKGIQATPKADDFDDVHRG
ncbi:hypothetical protein SAMN05216222_0479 [Pseudomonas prosekii]|uniref:Uncharacterized protein n=1 Tax=Pseudomonas prosekii TaxID=1148509 RepID=A0A1H1NNA1_9PSED|nr:hypothetical protein SAMN05216222_0479 [Pseudomonas prosekii]